MLRCTGRVKPAASQWDGNFRTLSLQVYQGKTCFRGPENMITQSKKPHYAMLKAAEAILNSLNLYRAVRKEDGGGATCLSGEQGKKGFVPEAQTAACQPL